MLVSHFPYFLIFGCQCIKELLSEQANEINYKLNLVIMWHDYVNNHRPKKLTEKNTIAIFDIEFGRVRKESCDRLKKLTRFECYKDINCKWLSSDKETSQNSKVKLYNYEKLKAVV